MDNCSLSIIIPTLGRASLVYAIRSAFSQLLPGDEIIVVGDGSLPRARQIADSFGHPVRYFETSPTRLYGYSQRTFGMSKAMGDYLAFMDDDDVYVDNALNTIRLGIHDSSAQPLMFRMQYGENVLWGRKKLKLGNVGTPMFVVPNNPELLGSWEPITNRRQAGDYVFITSTLLKYPPDSLVWRSEIVAKVVRPSHGQFSRGD